MNGPPRFVIPHALLVQLRERRAQQRLNGPERARTSTPRSLIATYKKLIDSPRPDMTSAATSFVDGMNKLQREVEDAEDAFLLDPGMGPMIYITADGRVLEDHRSWDGEALGEATLDEAIAALVVGAKKTGITDLLSLIPPCPCDASRCPRCEGERWDKPLRAHGLEVICTTCRGRGYLAR